MHYRGTNTSLKLLLFLFLLACAAGLPGAAYAIGGVPLWSSTDAVAGKHEAKAMTVDSAGNTIVVGYTGANANDYYVAKFKADGTGTSWAPAIFGGTGEDVATAVTVDSKNNIIVTGYTWNGSDKDIHTVKYCGSADPATDCPGKVPGEVLWEHTLANTSGNDSATAVAVDGSDNIYVAGSYFNGGQMDDYVVIKYPSAGTVPTWTEFFGDDVANPNKINKILAMAVNGTGIAVTGYSGRGTTFDMLTRKYGFDQSLIRQWRHSDSGDCQGKAVRMDAAGNVIVTGSGTNALGNKDIYTVKYDPASDTPLWQKTYNGNSTDEPVGLWVDGAGDAYVTGVTNTLAGNDDFFTARYDGANGDLKWQAVFDAGNDATDIPSGIVVDNAADGGVFVTGYSTVSGTDDFMTLKYRKDSGVLLWEKAFNGSDNKNDRAIGIALEPAGGPVPGSVYVAGWSDSIANGYNYQVVKYDYGALNAPSNLTAVAASDTSITLTWYDNSTNEEKFVIERKLGEAGTWGAITPDKTSSAPPNDTTIIPAVPATTYTNGSLTANNYYYYRLRAWNSADTYSDYSNEARALTKVVSYAPPSWSYLYNGADNLDDVATAITVGTDNHPVVTGYSDLTEEGVEGMYSYDYMTLKLDRADKSIKWKARYDSGDGGTDMAAGVALDSAGNVLVTGTAYLAGGGDKSDDLYTRKVATAGLNDPAATPAFMWDHQYGTLNGIDLATAIAMLRDGSNNSVVIGHGGNSAVPQNDDTFIIKYDNNGARPWAPLPADPQATIYDSGRNDIPSAMAFDASGNIFVTGYSYDTTADPSASYDWFTAKYNGATGELIWSDVFDSGFGADKALSVDADKDGNAYVTGYAKNSAGNFVFHTIKYDGALVPQGTRRIWSASYNNTVFDARAVAVKVDPVDGAVVVGGTSYVSATDSDFHLIRYNPADGTEIWNRNFDRAGYDYVTTMTMDASGYIYLAGNTRTGPDTDSDFNASSDVLSLIYDYEGTYLGAMSYPTPTNGRQDEATAITVNNIGEAFIAGYSRNANVSANMDYIVLKQINPYLLVPGAFTATTQADYTKMDLTWQVPASGPSFKIYRTPGPSNPLSVWTLVSSPGVGAVSYPDTTLPLPGTNYCYAIEAISGSLNSRRTETCATTRLSKPVLDPLTVVSTTQISLSWSQVPGNTGYKIERKIGAGAWGDLTTTPAGQNSYTDPPTPPTGNLTPGTTYYYRVSTNSAPGYSLPSNEQFKPTMPVAPTLNAPSGVTNTQMVLGWNAPTGATTYTLQKKLSTDLDTSYANITTPNNCTNIAATSCTVTGLTPNTTYSFRVMATNTGGNSVWSNVQTRQAALAVPTWATSPATPTNITNTGMTMTWVNPAVAGSGTITYTLQYSLTSGSYVDETTASACSGTTALTCNVTGLTPNRTYYYRIKATNASGSSAWSTEKSGLTLLDTPTLSIATGGALKVDLTWTAVSEATGYTIQQSLCTDSTNPSTCRGVATSYAAFSNKGTTTGNGSTTYSAASLAAGSNYRYQIIATVAGNTSAASNILHAWTNLPPPVVTITPVSSTALTPGWVAQPGETNYTVEVSTNGIGGSYSAIPAATGLAMNTLTYPHTGLALDTEYCYQVKAYSTEAVPPPAVYSTPVCKTTPPDAPVLSLATSELESSYSVIEDSSKYWTMNNYLINRPVVIYSGANIYTKRVADSVNSAFYASPAFTTETINQGDSYVVLQTVSGTATGSDGAAGLLDAHKNWGMNDWLGYKIKIINSVNAANVGLERTLSVNGATNTYATANFGTTIVAGDTYRIASFFGTANAAGTTTQLNQAASGTINGWAGYYLMMTSGANNGHARRIISNTTTALITDAFPNASASGDTYLIAQPARIGPYFGTAAGTAPTTTVLYDTAHVWQANYTGYYLQMTSGPNQGKSRLITANDSTAKTITVSPGFDTANVLGNTYALIPSAQFGSYFGKAAGAPGTTTELTDTANTWLTDWTQGYSLMMTSGANSGQARPITGKTATTLTTAPFANAIAIDDTYLITPIVRTATYFGKATSFVTNSTVSDTAYAWQQDLTGYYLYMTSGLNQGKAQPVTAYNNTTKTFTVSPVFTSNNAANNTFALLPSADHFGTATGSPGTSYTELVDTTKTWTTDWSQGYFLMMTSGLNNGQARNISARTETTITLATPFANPILATDTYLIGTIAITGRLTTAVTPASTTKGKAKLNLNSGTADLYSAAPGFANNYNYEMLSLKDLTPLINDFDNKFGYTITPGLITTDTTLPYLYLTSTYATVRFDFQSPAGKTYQSYINRGRAVQQEYGRASAYDAGTKTISDARTMPGSAVAWKNWSPVDKWKDYYVQIISGPNNQLVRKITASTTNSITLDNAFPNDPSGVTGVAAASGNSNTKLVDSTGTTTWTTNIWVSYTLVMVDGPNAGKMMRIASNDATSVTVEGTGFASPIESGNSYKIVGDSYRINVITGNAATNGNTVDGFNNTNTVLIDSSRNIGSTLAPKYWTTGPDQWAGFYLYMSSGPNIGLFRTIAGNTASSITVDTPFPYQIGSNDSYTIYDPRAAAQAIEAYWVQIYDPIYNANDFQIIPSSETSGKMRIARTGSALKLYTSPTAESWTLRRQIDLSATDAFIPNSYWIYQLGRLPHVAGTNVTTNINNFAFTVPAATPVNISSTYWAPEVGHTHRKASLGGNTVAVGWNKALTSVLYEVERCNSQAADQHTPTIRVLTAPTCATYTLYQPADGGNTIISSDANTGLIPGYTYRFRVRNKYNATDYTAWSNEQWITVTPPAPVMVAPTVASTLTTQLTPTWNNVYGDNGYYLYWKLRSGASCTDDNWSGPIAQAINIATYNHTGLTAGTFYCYKIRATGPTGPPVTQDSLYSNIVSQSTKPLAPGIITFSEITSSTITLTWPQVAGNSGYQIDRSLDNVTWTNNIATVAADVVTYPNTGLGAGTRYYYRVSAASSGGFSAVSAVQSTTTTPPVPVITATPVSSAQIDLTWPLASGATEYRVEQKIGAGGEWGSIGTVTKAFTQSYCGYPVPRIGCTSLTPDSGGKSVTGLTENTYYCYQIKAWNVSGGESGPSDEKCTSTSTMPLPNLTATALDGGFKIRLDWVPFVCLPIACDAPTGYELQRQVWDDNWVLLKTVDGATLTYTDKIAIDPKKQYRYRVRSISGADKSPFSEATVFSAPYSAEANVCTE